MKAYEYGVSDIIYKPFESKIVMRRAQNIIELFQNRRDIEKKLEKRNRMFLHLVKLVICQSSGFQKNTVRNCNFSDMMKCRRIGNQIYRLVRKVP